MKRVAAIDLGKARVGLAIADELGLCAHPRPALSGENRRALLASLAQFAKDEGVELWLVGQPLELDGSFGQAADRAFAFAEQLANATGIEVELVDERLSTVEASRRLGEQGLRGRKARSRIDGEAAAVLLQSWLDGGRAHR